MIISRNSTHIMLSLSVFNVDVMGQIVKHGVFKCRCSNKALRSASHFRVH